MQILCVQKVILLIWISPLAHDIYDKHDLISTRRDFREANREVIQAKHCKHGLQLRCGSTSRFTTPADSLNSFPPSATADPLELGAAKTLFQRYRVGTFTPETMVKTLRARRKGSHLRLFSAGRKGQHTILLQKMFESHDKILTIAIHKRRG